jgi:hypothetical protein
MIEADLEGAGQNDFIFANRKLGRLSERHGQDGLAVLAGREDGLVDPQAVWLADLNGDGLPDLVVANGTGHNLLVFPGLGNGQFGPEVNGGKGFAAGTDPVDVYVAEARDDPMPELVVADQATDTILVLFDHGQGDHWDLELGGTYHSGSGPTSVRLYQGEGDAEPSLVITDGGENAVRILTGLGHGLFDDRSPRILHTGAAPRQSLIGDFTGQGRPDLITINSGSNDLTLFKDFMDPASVGETISSGGQTPITAVAGDINGDHISDLVVANSGDGNVAVLLGAAGGPRLAAELQSPGLHPTALAGLVAGLNLTGVYVADAGSETASLLSFSSLAWITDQQAPAAGEGPRQAADPPPTVDSGPPGDLRWTPIVDLQPLTPDTIAIVPTLVAGAAEQELGGGRTGPARSPGLADSPLRGGIRGESFEGDDAEEAITVDGMNSGKATETSVARFVLGIEEAVHNSSAGLPGGRGRGRGEAEHNAAWLALPGRASGAEAGAVKKDPVIPSLPPGPGVCPVEERPFRGRREGGAEMRNEEDRMMKKRQDESFLPSSFLLPPSSFCHDAPRTPVAVLDALFASDLAPGNPARGRIDSRSEEGVRLGVTEVTAGTLLAFAGVWAWRSWPRPARTHLEATRFLR